MTKQEFLEELKHALSGKVSAEIMMDSYRYYANYIEEGLREGKTEEQILEELGKPALIARSIIAAQTGERMADEEYTEEGKTRHIKRRNYSREKVSSETVHKEFVFDYTSWYAKVLYIAIAIFMVMLVFCIIKGLFWIFIKFGIPILIILGIVYLVMYFLN